jgi:uncharacterized protein with LGFP repeats
MNTRIVRAAAGVGGLAIAAAFAVSCSATKDATEEALSSASSIGASAASAAGSAASSVGSAASSAISSGASAASSAVSSVAAAAISINAPGVGDITLNPASAATYTRLGGAAVLGAPIATPEKVKDAVSGGEGTVYQFANGTIYDSPDRGAYMVQGEILKAYEKEGGPGGALGWPTTDEEMTGGGPKAANGGWVSTFANGSISWLNDGKGNFSETVTKK